MAWKLLFSPEDLSHLLGRIKKYPKISHSYESVDYVNLFFAGTATHSLDFRKSSGGFIHGFRYTGLKICLNKINKMYIDIFFSIWSKSAF